MTVLNKSATTQRRFRIGILAALITVITAGYFFLRRTDPSQPLGAPALRAQGTSLFYSPDGSLLVDLHLVNSPAQGRQFSFWVWDARSGKAVSHWAMGPDFWEYNRPFFVGGRDHIAIPTQTGLALYDVPSGKLIRTENPARNGLIVEQANRNFRTLLSPRSSIEAFSADGKYAICFVNTLQTGALGKHEGSNHLVLDGGEYRRLNLLPDRHEIEIALLDIPSGIVRQRFKLPRGGARVAFQSNHTLAFAAEESAFLLDLQTGKQEPLPDAERFRKSVDVKNVSPDGRHAITPVRSLNSLDQMTLSRLAIVERTTGGRMRWPINERLDQAAHSDLLNPANQVQFTPDGKYLVLADDHISLWDARNGTPVRDLTRRPSDPTARFRDLFSEQMVAPHLPPVTALAVSPNSQQAAFIQDNQLRVVPIE